MTPTAPKFTYSEYFKSKPDWHLEEGAADEDKDALEKFMNTKFRLSAYKEAYPNMKNPYYAWNGEIIDKG